MEEDTDIKIKMFIQSNNMQKKYSIFFFFFAVLGSLYYMLRNKYSTETYQGVQVLNKRRVNGKLVDPSGRFYTACYGADDGYGGKGAYNWNQLHSGQQSLWSIALPRGRRDGKDVATYTNDILTTTDYNHPLVSSRLKKSKPWSESAERQLMSDPNKRPIYLMVDQDGRERCVRVDDKCQGCYTGDRGIGGKHGFDIDVYVGGSDGRCYERRPNQFVKIYKNSSKCNPKWFRPVKKKKKK